MKRLLKYIIVVIIGVGGIDMLFSCVIEKFILNVSSSPLAPTYDAKSEIAILGASRAHHHYNPQIMSDSLKLTTYNYGIDGHNIYFHYAMLNSLITNSEKKPKVVILELGAIDINDTPQWNTEKMNILYPYYNIDPIVKTVLSDILSVKELFVISMSGLYRQNSNYVSIIKDAFCIKDTIPNNGFLPLKGKWNEPIKEEKEHGDNIDLKKVEYLENVVKLCRDENVKLVFSISPNYKILNQENWKNEVKLLAKEQGIPVIDHEQDISFLNHREWFNEPFHLNEKGADIYSRLVADEIKNIILNN